MLRGKGQVCHPTIGFREKSVTANCLSFTFRTVVIRVAPGAFLVGLIAEDWNVLGRIRFTIVMSKILATDGDMSGSLSGRNHAMKPGLSVR